MILKNLFKAILLLILFSGCSPNNINWQPLFNGKDLSGWDTYLGPEYDSTLIKLLKNLPILIISSLYPLIVRSMANQRVRLFTHPTLSFSHR